ncbi:MAG: alpha/beta hydrolase fold domain-containing protein, partial [Rhodospirillaceae bacterium]|nr:alpha/beta hydrolase fold domain-containing protein [Rhodospirillaceae bacterium]
MINEAPPIDARPMDPVVLAERRQEGLALYGPAGEALLARNGGRAETVSLGGVRSQLVTPRETRGGNAVLYLFGGGYVQGSPEEDLCITATIAHETGYRVYAPYYRLAPEHPYPAALDDARAVYRALLETHDAAALTVMGESAGAGLALSLMIALAQDGLALPGRLALLSPWSDLTAT